MINTSLNNSKFDINRDLSLGLQLWLEDFNLICHHVVRDTFINMLIPELLKEIKKQTEEDFEEILHKLSDTQLLEVAKRLNFQLIIDCASVALAKGKKLVDNVYPPNSTLINNEELIKIVSEYRDSVPGLYINNANEEDLWDEDRSITTMMNLFQNELEIV